MHKLIQNTAALAKAIARLGVLAGKAPQSGFRLSHGCDLAAAVDPA